jgi:hypothetical protein
MSMLDWYTLAVMACPVAIAGVVVCLVIHAARVHADIERTLDELRGIRERQTRHGSRVASVESQVGNLRALHNRLAKSHGTLLGVMDSHIAAHVETFIPSDN